MKRTRRPPVLAVLLGAALFSAALLAGGCSKGKTEGTSVAEAAWCETHDVPEAQDPICGGASVKPLDVTKDWCKEHGVPESRCRSCHPDVPHGLEAYDWCREHGVPESHCTLCNPDLLEKAGTETGGTSGTADPRSPSKLALVTPEVSAEAGVPVPPGCPSAGKRIRFASVDIASRAGIEIARAGKRSGHVHAECLAEVDFDPDRFSRVSAPSEGVLREVRKETGDRVRKGETLAILESQALGETAARLLETAAELELRKRAHEREESLRAKGISSSAAVEEALAAWTAARAAHARARADLAALGLPDSRIDAISRGDEARSRFAITSPLDGVVILRDCASGERVSPDRTLFEVADPTRVQALLDLREEDLAGVRPGQRVVFRPDGLDGRSYPGTLESVGSRVDPETRTVRARASLRNPDGALRAHLFGTAAIEVESEGEAVWVPASAVQWEGCCHVVFVRMRDDLFLPRRVELGPKNGDEWLVRKGLLGGEEIATTGSFLLKTELLKGSIGAGCCEVDSGESGS